MKTKNICMLGGTGFVGGHLADLLADRGHRVRVLSRHPERHRELAVHPRIELLGCNVHDSEALRQALAGADVVINLVGILNESGHDGSGFRRVHVELPQKIVEACVAEGIPRVLHMSALNADPSEGKSAYLRTKGEGERLMHAAAGQGLAVTSFRPSVIFGPGDSFFNRFAGLLRLAPGVFPLACPDARFAPVYVMDVAEAFARALEDRATIGQSYELCGPRDYRLRELVTLTAEYIGRPTLVIGLGPGLSKLQARLLEWAPGKPFSLDNYWSLQHDSLCREDGLGALGITPTAVEAVVPGYLAGRTQRHRYNLLRRHAHR